MKLHRYGSLLALPIAVCAIGWTGCSGETSTQADALPPVESAPPEVEEVVEAEIDFVEAPPVDAAPPADAADIAEATEAAEEAAEEIEAAADAAADEIDAADED